MVVRSFLLLFAAFGIAAWMPGVAGLQLTKLIHNDTTITVAFPRKHYANTIYFFVESGPNVKGKKEHLTVKYEDCIFQLYAANGSNKVAFELWRPAPATSPPKATFESDQGFAFKIWGPNLYYGAMNGSAPSFLRCMSAGGGGWCNGLECTAHLNLTKTGDGIGFNVSVLDAKEVKGTNRLADTSGYVKEEEKKEDGMSVLVLVAICALILLIVVILALLIAGIIGYMIGVRKNKKAARANKKAAGGLPARSPAAGKDQDGGVTQGGVTQGVTQGGGDVTQVTEKQTATPANTPGPASGTPAQTPKNNNPGGLDVKTVRY